MQRGSGIEREKGRIRRIRMPEDGGGLRRDQDAARSLYVMARKDFRRDLNLAYQRSSTKYDKEVKWKDGIGMCPEARDGAVI